LFHRIVSLVFMKNTTALIQITPNPTRCHRVDDPDQVAEQRRLDCRSYGACVDVAADADWRGFHCGRCAAYQPQTAAERRRDNLAILDMLAESQVLSDVIHHDETADVEVTFADA
jgi:hypothetical protein